MAQKHTLTMCIDDRTHHTSPPYILGTPPEMWDLWASESIESDPFGFPHFLLPNFKSL